MDCQGIARTLLFRLKFLCGCRAGYEWIELVKIMDFDV